MIIKEKDIKLNTNQIVLKDFKNTSTYNGFISDDELLNALKIRMRDLKANDLIVQKERYYIEKTLRPVLNDSFNYDLKSDDRKNSRDNP